MLRILLDVLHFTIPIHHTMRVLPFLGICRISAIRVKIACPATDQLSRHSVLALLVQEHRCTEVCCRMDAHTHGATEVLQFSAFWLVLWRWRWPFYAYDWFIIIRFCRCRSCCCLRVWRRLHRAARWLARPGLVQLPAHLPTVSGGHDGVAEAHLDPFIAGPFAWRPVGPRRRFTIHWARIRIAATSLFLLGTLIAREVLWSENRPITRVSATRARRRAIAPISPRRDLALGRARVRVAG